MIYNLKTKSGRDAFREKVRFLLENAKDVIRCDKVRKLRTTNQNSYVHLCLGLFALETGFTRNEIKQDFWKRELCRDIFMVKKKGREVCRSSADLDTKEMTICIERLRNYASVNGICYIPAPNEDEQLKSLSAYLQQYGNAQYI